MKAGRTTGRFFSPSGENLQEAELRLTQWQWEDGNDVEIIRLL